MSAEPRISFEEWMSLGVGFGYCTEPVCSTHDGIPTTEEEQAQFEDGYDPCIPAVRLLATRGD
jgi:hypothetical protein